MRDAIDRACAAAWANNREPANPSLLNSQGTAQKFELQLTPQLRRWELELYQTSGRLEQDYKKYLDTLQLYAHLPPGKLSQAERDAARVAAKGVLRTFRALAHFHNRPEETEGRILWAGTEPPPGEHFDRLVDWCMWLPENDADEENDEDAGAQEAPGGSNDETA